MRTLLAAAHPLVDVVFQQGEDSWSVATSDGSQFTVSNWADWKTPGVMWVDEVSGDFDGDGLQDVAARNLQTGDWRVGLSNGESFVASDWVRWNANKSWGHVQVADFNGDGRDDIAGRIQDAGDGRWFVSLSTGSSFTFHQHWYTWNPNVNWGQIATGDFNGDGLADIVGRVQDTGDGRWFALISTGSKFLYSNWNRWLTHVGWGAVHIGDYNGDGRDDIAARIQESNDGRWFLGLSDGSKFNTLVGPNFAPGRALSHELVGDFDGDGDSEIAARLNEDGRWFVLNLTGSTLGFRWWATWGTNYQWSQSVVGDFNGDGRDDIAALSRFNNNGYVALSDGTHFHTSVWGHAETNDLGYSAAGNFHHVEDDLEQRRAKLDEVVLGMHAYHNEFRQFPVDNVPELLDSDGRPFLSWRVHILPFLGYGDLFQQFHLDEPWDSPHNLTLLDEMPDLFRTRGLAPGTNRSGFRVFEGPGAYDYDADGGPEIRDAADGVQQTLLVMETLPQDAALWTQPDGIPFDPADPLGSLTLPPDFFLASTVDGKVREVNPAVAPANFAATLTWDGDEVLTSDQFTNIYLDWASEDSYETSQNKLRAIGLAFFNFHDVHLRFPPGDDPPPEWIDPDTGLPYLSWRVHLLPYLGYVDLYNQFRFDEPWNSANNIQLLDKMPEAFRSRGISPDSTVSAFKIITGPEAYRLDDVTGLGFRFQNIIDGTNSTIAVVELMPDKAVPWTQWNEIEYSPGNPLDGIAPIPADGLRVLKWDGSTNTLAPQATAANFAIFATTNQSELFGPAETLNVFQDWATGDSERRANNLRQIGLAMHNYHDKYLQFPVSGGDNAWDEATGLPHLSWRVHLLPFLGYSALYDEFHVDEAWDSPHNIQLLDKMPEVFRTRGVAADSHLTALKLFIGDDAYAYDTDDPETWRWSGPGIREIEDGTSNTILAIELLADQAVEWTRPDGDIMFDPSDPLAGVGTIPADGLLALLFDGGVKTVNPEVAPENFKTYVTTDGGEIYGPTESTNVFPDWQRPVFTGELPYPRWIAADSLARKNNLKHIGLTLHNYHDTHGGFPVDEGSSFDPETELPHLSWRVHLLPYLGYGDLYNEFHLDEPWDSPHNIQLLDKMPEVFRSRGLPSDSTKTGLQLFFGDGAWTYQYSPTSTSTGPGIRDITDGTSNTIAVIETMPEDAVEWTRPDGDIAWDPADPYGGLTIPPDFFLAVMFDGSVHPFHPFLDEEEFRALVTFAGGEPVTYV